MALCLKIICLGSNILINFYFDITALYSRSYLVNECKICTCKIWSIFVQFIGKMTGRSLDRKKTIFQSIQKIWGRVIPKMTREKQPILESVQVLLSFFLLFFLSFFLFFFLTFFFLSFFFYFLICFFVSFCFFDFCLKRVLNPPTHLTPEIAETTFGCHITFKV